MNDALKIAVEKFKNLNFEDINKIQYLNRQYSVSPDGEVTCLEKNREATEREKIIILHYLAANNLPAPGTGKKTGNKLIDFREVPSGNMYYSSFEARVYQPFLNFFGKKPSLFIKASKILEGEQVDFGNVTFKFIVLPEIPVYFILYEEDEEFPAACKVLFDSSIKDYFPTEDIAIICEDTVIELIQKIK